MNQNESTSLNPRQIRDLRRLAHGLKPAVRVGQHGIHKGLIEELDQTLEVHELVKVRVSAADRQQRAELIERLQAACGAQLVQRVGHMAVLFRRNPKAPRIHI